MQALVEHKGKQFLVEENLELKLPYLGGKIGEKIQIEKILYTDDSKKKEFGKPYLTNFSISGKILSHGKDEKIVVFKMKRRKGYQVKNGHRQNFTMVKIEKFKKTTAAKKISVTKEKTATATTKKESVAQGKTVAPNPKKESK